MKVPIRDIGSNDEMYWSKESHGHYSVRSAYRLLQAQKIYWREEDNGSFWRKVWRIKAPPKILNLVWRSLTHCLPTTVMLQQKGVSVHTMCPVCRMESETVDHVFRRCTHVVQCWQLIDPSLLSVQGDWFQWWEYMVSSLSPQKRAEVAYVCWSLWKARNEVVWHYRNTRVYVIVAEAKQYLEQWRHAQSITAITRFPQLYEGDGGSSWVKPQLMQIKVSVDAATFMEFNASGIGMVARDSWGELLLSRTVCIRGSCSAETAEVLAIKEALSWIKIRNGKGSR